MKFLKYIPYLIIVILAWLLMAKGCKSTPQFSEPRIVFKDRIIKLAMAKDSTMAMVKKEDSIRVKYIVKWRDRKADTIFKECEELILICDTIIRTDSSEIASLKQVIKIDSSIISTQKIMLHSDSLDIKCLKKQIRKQKRQKAAAITGLIIVGSAAILK